MLIDIGSEELNITRHTIQWLRQLMQLEIQRMARAQRHMPSCQNGVVEAGCSKKEMLALANDQINDPTYTVIGYKIRYHKHRYK